MTGLSEIQKQYSIATAAVSIKFNVVAAVFYFIGLSNINI